MHYMTVLVIEYESTAYQQYKMAKKKLGVFFQFFAREATLSNRQLRISLVPKTSFKEMQCPISVNSYCISIII